MAQGISGDSGSGPLIGGYTPGELMTIELRVVSNLLQTFLGVNGGGDGLGVLRNDQAFELQLPTPIPGAGR
jgi:hypothetical protein